MNSPTVSVVMINYNGLPWLEASVASVLATVDTDIELIIVDDCSKDDSREFISRMANMDSRVTPHFLAANEGISGARNAGIDIAQGNYISLVDSDDIFFPDTVSKQIEAFEQLQKQAPDLSLLTSDAWLINEAGERKGRYISRDWWDRVSAVNPPLWTLPSTFFFRKDNSARFHPAYRSADAPIFISRMAKLGSIGFTGEPLVEYRLRMSSVTNKKGAEMLREMVAAGKSLELDRLEDPLSAAEVEAPSWSALTAWVSGRNAKNAAANGRMGRAAIEVTKAVIADPSKTAGKLLRSLRTFGRRFGAD